MNILILNWRDIKNPEAGGVERHLHEIFKRIAKHHRVTLISSRYNGCKEVEDIEGIKVIRIGNKFLFNFYAFWYYFKKLRGADFDVVVDDVSKVPLFTPLFIKKPLIAIIHHVHGKTLFRELPLLIALYVYLLERMTPIFYRKTTLLVVSESTKEELAGMGIPKENISVVYNGLNPELRPGKKSEQPLVIYFGRIKRYKQLDHLIKAFKIVHAKISEAELIIAGKGDCYEELLRLKEELNLNSVRFCGWMNEKQKMQILQSGWIYVIPSMKEGWGISTLEANACGTPAIAYDVPGLRDSIKHGKTGLLVESGNIKALSEAIINVLEDEELREKLSKNALEYSEQFSWDESAVQVLRVLGGMVK